MKAFKFYIFRISLAVIFGLLPMTVWAGDKLTHYEGIANKKGDYNWNGTQKCHELIYYYYVTKGQKELELTLPFADGISDLEPRGYYRWYDWTTDLASSRLTKVGSRLYSFDNGKGLYAVCLKDEKLSQGVVGVTYSAPSGTDYDSWEADTIACDVSRYHDGITVGWGTNFEHEPTLSIRYKFVIRKASWIADQLRRAVVDSRTGARTFEDNQDVTIGINRTDNGKSEANLRLNYNNVNRYYFYPLTTQAFNNKHIYYQSGKEAENKFEESDFSDTPIRATAVKWRVYDETNTYYCEIDAESQPRFVKISPYKLNDRDWTHITTGEKVRPGSSQLPKFKTMSRFNVVAYLGASNQWCPVANFSCRFAEEYPVLFDELNTGAPTRTLSYIEDHYVKVTEPISFDNLSDGMTYDAPTKDNNVAPNPSKWELRHYGFVYKKLAADSKVPGWWWFNDCTNAPVHGEYGVYKTADVSGISTSSEGYKWWYRNNTSDNMNLYDRTYGLTTGKQAGYFLYVDASDESREIASDEFTANLCSGTTFIVSAAIADLTLSGQTAPQVMFKLYGDNGDRVVRQENLIHSFASCDMMTVVNNYQYGKWYQVYAKVTLRDSENLRKFQKFLVTVDNYCPSTSGADYAVDDIRFYQKRAIVDVIQNQPVCDDATTAASVKLKLRAVYESLQSRAFVDRDGKSKVYYRFVDEKGEPVDLDYGNGGKKYGVCDFHYYQKDLKAGDTEIVNGETYYILVDKAFKLPLGKKLYVSLSFDNPDDASMWGNRNVVCSSYSELFEMMKQTVMIRDAESKVIADYRVSCERTNADVTMNADLHTTDPYVGGGITITGVKYDWFIGSKEEFNKTHLLEALHAFRDKNSTGTSLGDVQNSGIDAAYLAEIKTYIDNGKLILAATSQLKKTFEFGTHTLCLLPITKKGNIITINNVDYQICPDPIEYKFRVLKDGPRINLGFVDGKYPNDQRIVRIGLPQLKDMQQHTKFLQIPISSTEPLSNSSGSVSFEFNTEDGIQVLMDGTNDPMWKNNAAVLGKKDIFTITVNSLKHLNKETDQRTLDLQVCDDYAKYLHEGYWYDLSFSFMQKNATTGNEVTSCPGTTFFRIYVVPEFATWAPAADGGMNNNWNNDLNWRRSTKTELYKSDADTYPVYGTTAGYTELKTQQAFVPMKFTKVTILTPYYNNGYYPLLGYLQKGSDGILNKLNNGASTATDYIQYDMMVDDGSKLGYGATTPGRNYSCVKFYGNTCDQIYFKPGAEVRNQHYLVYSKAWVEQELSYNRWYLFGSPLKNMVAGDMYVPVKTGRQETEAFLPITFDATVNNRTKMPFYQRSWDRSDTKEYSTDGNYDAYDYSSLPVSVPSTIGWNTQYWSHVYNAASMVYSPKVNADGSYASLNGFAVKVGDKYTPAGISGKALVRLPKDDKTYDYYDPSTNLGGLKRDDIDRTDDGKGNLIIASVEPSSKEGAIGAVDVTLAANAHQGAGDGNYYYLTYNPYMATLDMKRFFANAKNKAALGEDNVSYWVVNDNEANGFNTITLDGETDGRIAPMQAFFIKSKTAQPTIHFDTNMTVDKDVTKGVDIAGEEQNSRIRLQVGKGTASSSYLILNADASQEFDGREDTELLGDDLLADVPAVYTVASSQAVMVNSLPEIYYVPLGVVAKKSELMSLNVQGAGRLSSPLYLYDAATRKYQEIKDGEEVKVQANEHGRYFLTQTRSTTGIENAEMDESDVKIYSPSRGLIVVSKVSAPLLNKVEVYTLDGRLVASRKAEGAASVSIPVVSTASPQEVYIIKVSMQDTQATITRKLSLL